MKANGPRKSSGSGADLVACEGVELGRRVAFGEQNLGRIAGQHTETRARVHPVRTQRNPDDFERGTVECVRVRVRAELRGRDLVCYKTVLGGRVRLRLSLAGLDKCKSLRICEDVSAARGAII